MPTIAFHSLPADVCQSLVDLAAADGGLARIDAAAIARLPVSFLAACQQVAKQDVRVGLMNLPDVVRLALSLIDGPGMPQDLLGELPSSFPDGPPFQIAVGTDGTLVVTVLPGICSHPQLGIRETYGWLDGLQPTALVIDLAVVEHVNSVLVSWILQISQHASPVKPRLRHASRAIAVQMGRLRLDHLVDIDPL